MKNHTFIKIKFSYEIVISSSREYYSLGEGNMCRNRSLGAFRVVP